MLNQTYRSYFSTVGEGGSPSNVSSNSKERRSEHDLLTKKVVTTSSPSRGQAVCKELLRAVSSDSKGSATTVGGWKKVQALQPELSAMRCELRSLQKSATKLVKERERELKEEATWEVSSLISLCSLP